MARSTARPVVRLKSTAGTGVTYVTRKNRLNDPDRLVLRKYDRWRASTFRSARNADPPPHHGPAPPAQGGRAVVRHPSPITSWETVGRVTRQAFRRTSP